MGDMIRLRLQVSRPRTPDVCGRLGSFWPSSLLRDVVGDRGIHSIFVSAARLAQATRLDSEIQRLGDRNTLTWEEIKMRIIVFLLAAAAVSGPAAAQCWQDYSYPEYAFSAAFPATPNVETTTYQAANGRSVPARVYSVRQGNELLKVTVADLANTGLDEPAVIDHAIKMLSAGGVVTFNIPQRIYRVYGRSLGIQGGDGSRSMVGVFDYHGRLYQIEAKALPGGSAAATLRFQQSLVFTDGGSNRSEEEIRAFRQGCPGPVGNPAGLDDPRCARPGR